MGEEETMENPQFVQKGVGQPQFITNPNVYVSFLTIFNFFVELKNVGKGNHALKFKLNHTISI